MAKIKMDGYGVICF